MVELVKEFKQNGEIVLRRKELRDRIPKFNTFQG
jgi:hypothetical protein